MQRFLLGVLTGTILAFLISLTLQGTFEMLPRCYDIQEGHCWSVSHFPLNSVR